MKVLIAIPAYNEELILAQNILRLFNFCQANLTDEWSIVIADNHSSDRTSLIGKSLSEKFSQIHYLFVSQPGKGIAIKTAWQQFDADIYCFMDADLATDLSALPRLVSGIRADNDLVIGSRFHSQSKVRRSLKRQLMANGYRLLLKVVFNLKVNDCPCGFKAINQLAKIDLLPQVENDEWFFDSELVILAEKKGYRVQEIPVGWYEPRVGGDRSRVNTFKVGWSYFKKVIELKKRLAKL